MASLDWIWCWSETHRTKRRRRTARNFIAKADQARDARRWSEAAAGYASALAIDPILVAIHVQHGHALKENGDPESACIAYKRAIALDPCDPEAWQQLGHVQKLLGRPVDAIDAYRTALLVAPSFAPARDELIRLGARDAIPEAALAAGRAASAVAMQALTRLLEETRTLSMHTSDRYDDFRHAYPITSPPTAGDTPPAPLVIIIDGRAASAAEVRATLESLLDQVDRVWRSVVRCGSDMVEHPVASLAAVDERITFSSEKRLPLLLGDALSLDAGTILDPQTIGWIRYAATVARPAAIYCDHDHAEQRWRGPHLYFDPVLQPKFDPFWFQGHLSPPALIYARADHADRLEGNTHRGRILCDIAAEGGDVVHLPRILVTRLDTRSALAAAPADTALAPQAISVPALPTSATPFVLASFTIVIPTRDQAALLARCVETLLEQAHHPDRVEIVIIDNRSTEPATAALLASLAARPGVQVLPLDEPFNWPRANNLAVRGSGANHLVFVNNDTEMLTHGWDGILAGYLARPEVGIVGAKLLYPDRTIQHAGILFGMNGAPPAHEGVGAHEDEPGPHGRWIRPRAAAAVTGAFMAMRRDTWDAVGGFDELLPLGYNDVDMCLRVRNQGELVVYASDLLLIHYESKTRGHNVTRSQVAWDLAELRALYRRWGEALFEDPSFNPHWSRHGEAFAAYREPGMSEIVRQIGHQSRTPPAIAAKDEETLPR